AAEFGNGLAQKCEAVGADIDGLPRQPGNISARSRQPGDDAGADWIARRREYDRDNRRRLLGCEDWWGIMCENDIDLKADEFGGDLVVALDASLGPAIFDREIATVDPTKFPQPLNESGKQLAATRRRGRAQEPNGRQFSRLLRARRKRPSCRRAAEQRDELAPPHGSPLVGGGPEHSSRGLAAVIPAASREAARKARAP